MKAVAVCALLALTFTCAVGADARSTRQSAAYAVLFGSGNVARGPSAAGTSLASALFIGTPVPGAPPSGTPVPSALPTGSPVPVAPSTGSPAAGAPPAGTPPPGALSPGNASPAPSPTSAGRAHLHRPGTDVDGDVLTGSLTSEAYVLKGNVTLHSDPKIDREIAAASESDEPLTVTADEVDVDRLGAAYVAKGNVHFSQGTRSGRADLATLNEQTHTLDLIGNANVYDGERRAAAAKMHYNMLDKQFLGSGDVRIYEPLPTPNPSASGTPQPKRKRRLPL